MLKRYNFDGGNCVRWRSGAVRRMDIYVETDQGCDFKDGHSDDGNLP